MLDQIHACQPRAADSLTNFSISYQEMIAHVPLMCHSNPKKVLVIGGGDGGVLREIAKHKSVETIELVEIDEAVIRMSKTYFPKMAVGFDDSRVTVHITDGFEFLCQKKGEYDVIISDTSDPEGPAEQLFQLGYFKLLNEALTDNGVISMQASENVWLKIKVLEELKKTCKQVFPSVAYTAAIMPTYTSGQLGLMICSKDRSQDVSVPRRWWPEEDEKQLLRYYNRQIHSASFTLQTFAKKFIG